VVKIALTSANLMSLNSQRVTLERTRLELEIAEAPLKREYDHYQRIISDSNTRIAWINEHVPKGKLFLEKLSTSPQDLSAQLRSSILNSFNAYNAQHLSPSPQVRICLYNIEAKLATFFPDASEPTTITLFTLMPFP
jgi:hypothetical protein